MAEVGVSVAAKLAEYLVDPTLQQLQYLFCVGKITRNVAIGKKEMILKQGKMQERVQEAINRTERIDDRVDEWKNDVESLIVEVDKLEEELRANNGCLRGWCPTWRRYCLCKKLARATQRMIDLTTKCDCIKRVSHLVIAPNIQYRSSQNFKFFICTQMAFDQLWEALQDDGSSMTGLWGMGGSGKTSLVKEVGKRAKESQLFDRVVLTTISQSPDIRKIQGEIADTLGLELKEETEMGRANRIALRLQSGERILIILDDVWAMLKLEDIGIPMGGNHQRSFKVVLTTRRFKVCTSMKCQETIQLGLLEEDEAWTLFQTHANVDDAAKEVVARAIAMECKGLPIAIVALGTCLYGKEVDEMNVILYRLRNAKLNNVEDEDVRHAFACLQLSYDYLATQEAKLLLLMCAMFPEDHNIVVEDLFRYGVGLGLYRDVDFEIARSQVRATINYLINSSLLMHSSKFNTDAQEYVTMHDGVRDFTLWKAFEEGRAIKVNCREELNELIADEAVKNCYAISSWYDDNKVLQFPSQLDAPKLEFLLLRSRKPLDMSYASFECMKRLKALIMICTNYRDQIELRHPSIQHLSNLQTLRLQHWVLHDISFVVRLTRLEILDLQYCKFERMPNGIEKLNKLKLLDLSGCAIDECCYQVIGRCSQLEELYVPIHPPHSKNANCYGYLVGPTALMKLRRYTLEIGQYGERLLFRNESTRSLCLGQFNISMLGAKIKDLAQRAIAIEFYELKGGSKSFMPNIIQGVGGMKELTKLALQRCSEIECITDKTTPHVDAAVPRLDELKLEDMDNLKQLHHGPPPFNLFENLEGLSIVKCPQLLHIFPADCNVGNLKSLNISGCPMLTSLFPISVACTLLSLEQLHVQHCSELKHVIEGEGGGNAWENLRFPKLKTLSFYDCCILESICPVFIAQRFEQSQYLSIKNAPRMKFVFGENAGEEKLMYVQDENKMVFPPLEHLRLECLPNIVGLCSQRYHLRWPSIKTIVWRDCPNMDLQELKGHQLRNEEYKPLEAVESISLHNCGVESIFLYKTGVGEQIPTFQYLEGLALTNCAKLKFVFSAHICQSLPKLTYVTISRCEELEEIFSANEETQKNLSIAESCLLKLKTLEVSKCNKLKFIFSLKISAATSMLPQLSTLIISDCSQMEEIFKRSNIEDHDPDSEKEITFPNMERMQLRNLPRLVNVCQGFNKLHTGEFCRVQVHNCPKLMPIMGATIDWTKEGLVREYVLKYSQLNNNEALNLALSIVNARELDIQSPKVEHYWRVIGDDEEEETNDSKMLRSGEQMLGGVVPTQVLRFQYLHSLEVTHNKKLKILFSSSTIVQNSLPKLTSLTLSDCEELEVIFGHSSEDDAKYDGKTIVLSSLRTIGLTNLPNFMSVCQGLEIQVELSGINIDNCPKFVGSSLGRTLQQLGTISLPQVSREDSNIQTASNVEEQLPVNEEKGKVVISSAEHLNLRDSMNLTSVWEGPTFVNFQNLQDLYVSKCRKLKCMFPSTVIRSLPCLVELWIEECEELEGMMSSSEEHHYFPNASSHYSLCFPQLKYLGAIRCRKLKWLFPSLPSAQPLPHLISLTIGECFQIKGIYNNCEHEIHEEGFYNNNMLPNLRYLTVEDCSNFSKTTIAALQSHAQTNQRRDELRWRAGM